MARVLVDSLEYVSELRGEWPNVVLEEGHNA